MADLNELITQAISDFDGVKVAIEESGVPVPYDTDTKEYGRLVKQAVAENTQEGYDKGQQAEYDKFWDAYQEKGSKTSYDQYSGGFLGKGWTDENFKPKYPIVPTTAAYIFRATGITDLTKEGVVFDFSNCIAFQYAFAFCGGSLRKLPLIDLSKATNTTNMFAGGRFDSLSLVMSETTVISNSMFDGNTNLAILTVSGTIGMSINLSWSPLTVDSMKNVISCLKNYAGTDEELTYTLTFSSACWDALEAKDKAPDGGTWKEYVQSLGWIV